MKIFVTGVAGQLGHDVMNELNKRGYEGIGSDIAPVYSGAADGSAVTSMPYLSLDITNADAVKETIAKLQPDAVIHCAAWTAVDAAEEEENMAKVYAINVEGTKNIALACKECDDTVFAELLTETELDHFFCRNCHETDLSAHSVKSARLL